MKNIKNKVIAGILILLATQVFTTLFALLPIPNKPTFLQSYIEANVMLFSTVGGVGIIAFLVVKAISLIDK